MTKATIRVDEQALSIAMRVARTSRRVLGGLIVAAGIAILIAEVGASATAATGCEQLSPAVFLRALPSLAIATRQ